MEHSLQVVEYQRGSSKRRRVEELAQAACHHGARGALVFAGEALASTSGRVVGLALEADGGTLWRHWPGVQGSSFLGAAAPSSRPSGEVAVAYK